MAPKRPAAAAADEADAAHRDVDHLSLSPTPTPSPSPSRSRSRSRSKTPPPNLHRNAVALSSTPISAAVDLAAVSDSDVDGDADGRLPSPRRNRERSPSLHSDTDNPVTASDEGDQEDNGTPPHRKGRSSLIDAPDIMPISSRPMDGPLRSAAGSSQRRSNRPRNTLLALPRSSVLSLERQKRPPRVWSPEDEITILRALLSYRAKKGVLPASNQDTGKMHNEIRGKLSIEASTTQLTDKVRRLKHKFSLLVARRTRYGRDPEFPTVHDRDAYELSKKVWGLKTGGVGSGGGGGGGAYESAEIAESSESGDSDEYMEAGWDDPDHSNNKRLKAIAVANGNVNAIATGGRSGHGYSSQKGDVAKGKVMYPYLWEAVDELSKEHPSGTAFRKAFDVLEGSRALAMEEKLEKFKHSEIRQQLRRMDLMKETVKMVLDALEGTH